MELPSVFSLFVAQLVFRHVSITEQWHLSHYLTRDFFFAELRVWGEKKCLHRKKKENPIQGLNIGILLTYQNSVEHVLYRVYNVNYII